MDRHRGKSDFDCTKMMHPKEPDHVSPEPAGHSDDHVNAHFDEISRGYVGTLERYASLLKRTTDSIIRESEHAE
jgi:hypothetical protein